MGAESSNNIETDLGLLIALILSQNHGLKITDENTIHYVCIRGLKDKEILEAMKDSYCKKFPHLKTEAIQILDFSTEDFSKKIIVLDSTYDPFQFIEHNDYSTLSAVVVKDKQYS